MVWVKGGLCIAFIPTPASSSRPQRIRVIECCFLLCPLKSVLSRHATLPFARVSLQPTQNHCCSLHYELQLISISFGLLGDLGVWQATVYAFDLSPLHPESPQLQSYSPTVSHICFSWGSCNTSQLKQFHVYVTWHKHRPQKSCSFLLSFTTYFWTCRKNQFIFPY